MVGISVISDQLSVIRFEFSGYFLPITAKKPAKTQQFPIQTVAQNTEPVLLLPFKME